MTSRCFKRLWRLWPGVAATLMTWGLSEMGALTALENANHRSLFQLRGAQAWDDRIVLITVDDATLAELGQYPLPRDTYAALLRRLAVAPPAAIAFNILFIEPTADDDELAEAIAQVGNVVLATGVDSQGKPLLPTPPLRTAAIATGHILKEVERDGLVHYLTPQWGQQTALSLELAAVYGQPLEAAAPPDERLGINWPGPQATLTHYSLGDVLAGRIDPQAFAQKLVLVGMTATGIDALPTPFDDNPPASGLLLHAAVVDNTLQQRFLRPLPLPWLGLLGLLAMPGLSYWLMGQPLRWQLAILAGGVGGWLGLSVLLFYGTYWLPTVPPVLLWGLTGTTTILAQQLRANFALQQLLEDLWQHYRQTPHPTLQLSPPPPPIPDELGQEVQKLALLAHSLGWAQATQAAIAQAAPIGMLAVDEQHQVWFGNPLALEWLQISLGESLTAALVPQWLDAATWGQLCQQLSRGEAIAPLECQRDLVWFELRLQPLDGIGPPSPLLRDRRRGFLLLLEDITHRKAVEMHLRLLNEGLEDEVRQRAQQLETTNINLVKEILEHQQVQDKLAYQALHDELTGLPNRAQFKTALARLFDPPSAAPSFAVLFIDCDRFKLVNDSFGHLVGDELLKAIARRLRHCIARTDLVARFGGDEFTILLHHIQNPEAAVKVAQRIRQQLQKPFYIGDRQLYTGCSIGIVLSNDTYSQADDMLRDADTAMYRAKRGGIGFTLFEPEMHLAVRSSLQLELDLRRSLQQQELVVYYQPIFGIDTQAIAGFEALLRWRHPQHGVIGPAEFIPLAEETGLIIPIGQWVMQEACHQLRTWQAQNLVPADTFMSVNLSVQQFNEHRLLDRIDEILETTQLDSQYLKLEITESAIMANSDQAVKTFHHLKDRGIRLGIDDFGTGYSSLNYL
ncbi:MAG TPA: EAL domain-containing protein, partial [Candidatus Obscuribacterales bacterium]